MTERACVHGKPWKSTKVWNENCGKCEALTELNRSALNRLNGAVGGAEYGVGRMHPVGLGGQRKLDAINRRREAAKRYAERAPGIWSRRRQKGIAWRARAIEKVLAGPPVYPPQVAAALESTEGLGLTEKQREVLDMIYGRSLSQREAATALGISRAALRERLESVNFKLWKSGVEEVTWGDGRWNLQLRRIVGWESS